MQSDDELGSTVLKKLFLEQGGRLDEEVPACRSQHMRKIENDPPSLFPAPIYRQGFGNVSSSADSRVIEGMMSTTITTKIEIGRDVLCPDAWAGQPLQGKPITEWCTNGQTCDLLQKLHGRTSVTTDNHTIESDFTSRTTTKLVKVLSAKHFNGCRSLDSPGQPELNRLSQIFEEKSAAGHTHLGGADLDNLACNRIPEKRPVPSCFC